MIKFGTKDLDKLEKGKAIAQKEMFLDTDKKMKLKPEYKDTIVKVNSVGGLITFDTTETPETDYPTFHALGFDFCFEPTVPKYKEPILYTGIHQEKKASTKRNRNNDSKTSKVKGKKA